MNLIDEAPEDEVTSNDSAKSYNSSKIEAVGSNEAMFLTVFSIFGKRCDVESDTTTSATTAMLHDDELGRQISPQQAIDMITDLPMQWANTSSTDARKLLTPTVTLHRSLAIQSPCKCGLIKRSQY